MTCSLQATETRSLLEKSHKRINTRRPPGFRHDTEQISGVKERDAARESFPAD